MSRARLQVTHQHQGENNLKALEAVLEDSLTQSLSMKEERIFALESRLEESAARNCELSEELRSTERKLQALHQRHEEEAVSAHRTVLEMESSKSQQPAEFLQLKDHLVHLERQVSSKVCTVAGLLFLTFP